MLLELNISNFAIIDRLELRFNPGFNALTGETGAGKSIIIDAMSAMLGAKIGTEFIRHGQNQARVEGYFELKFDEQDNRFTELLSRLEEESLLGEDNRAPGQLNLTLSRELNISGRSVYRVNGSTVRQEVLREVGESLVNIHGQTEHVSLMNVSQHLELLDQYASIIPQRNTLSELVGNLRAMRKEMASLQRDERELARRVELLRFQAEEIEAARLQPGEEEELLKERQILNSAEKITSLADRTYRVLYQGFEDANEEGGYSGRGGRNSGGGGRSIQESLAEVEHLLTDLLRYDADLNVHLEAVQEAGYKLDDVAHAIREFRDRIEHDPNRLEEVEDRLELIRGLKRKYGATIPEILAFQKQAAGELNQIEHSGERLAELQTQEAKLLVKIGELAGTLSLARQEAARKLAAEVEKALRDLKLMRATFLVNLTRSEDKNGVPVNLPDNGTARYAFDGRGVDRAEFFVSLNPGEPPKPLQKVASGGETSRLMLALKSILAAADSIPTLIFDEVDVGVGGRSGQVVGEKLWQLTRAGDHQVLCITHLPQIAAFGDSHFNIVKQVVDERTVTTVRPLSETEIIDELAAMLGGLPVSDAMRTSAVQMLADVRGWKEAARTGTLADYVAQNIELPADPTPNVSSEWGQGSPEEVITS